MSRAALEACIRAAHAAGRPRLLARAYARAAALAGGEDEAAFLLTQAYVNALEAGIAEAPALFARLAAMGRDGGPGPGIPARRGPRGGTGAGPERQCPMLGR